MGPAGWLARVTRRAVGRGVAAEGARYLLRIDGLDQRVGGVRPRKRVGPAAAAVAAAAFTSIAAVPSAGATATVSSTVAAAGAAAIAAAVAAAVATAVPAHVLPRGFR